MHSLQYQNNQRDSSIKFLLPPKVPLDFSRVSTQIEAINNHLGDTPGIYTLNPAFVITAEKQRRLSAAHEVGHGIVAYLHGYRISFISIKPKLIQLDNNVCKYSLGQCDVDLPELSTDEVIKVHARHILEYAVAGIAAEIVFKGIKKIPRYVKKHLKASDADIAWAIAPYVGYGICPNREIWKATQAVCEKLSTFKSEFFEVIKILNHHQALAGDDFAEAYHLLGIRSNASDGLVSGGAK